MIGDLQGCYRPFLQLLEALEFDSRHDQLWLVGDLVNRGPESLECLRFVRDLGPAAVTVLGNHDLNLLALAHTPDPLTRANDTLKPILMAHDRDELLHWLRHQPLLHHDADLAYTMVHAGLHRHWSLENASAYAQEVETALRGEHFQNFLAAMYGNTPAQWGHELTGMNRLRSITNCLTRMRLCYSDGSLDMTHKGTLEDAPNILTPWFALPGRVSANDRIVFGHWSALSHLSWPEYNVWGTDSGCVWGRRITAVRLADPPEYISVDCS